MLKTRKWPLKKVLQLVAVIGVSSRQAAVDVTLREL